MMNLDSLNSVVEFEGLEYRVNLAFPVVLKMYDVLNDKGLTGAQQVQLALRLLVRAGNWQSLSVEKRVQLFNVIFQQCVQLKENKLAAKLFKTQTKIFDFNEDAGRIAASFLMQYQLDITDARTRNKVSWAFFNALLDGLNDDTPFRVATAYRSMKVPDDATAEQRDYINKMKLMYALGNDESSSNDGESLAQQMAGMDRIQRVKFLAAKLKKERGENNGK